MSTHTFITFADPYLVCQQCGFWVTSWHNPDECGCDIIVTFNLPCGHNAGITTVCPSWGPVDGCRCIEFLGAKDHAEPPSDTVDLVVRVLYARWTVNARTGKRATPKEFCTEMANDLNNAGLLADATRSLIDTDEIKS